MIKFVHATELKDFVASYLLEVKDEKPLIIAGYTGIGKTAIVNEVCKNCNFTIHSVNTQGWNGSDESRVVDRYHFLNDQSDLIQEQIVISQTPKIIEITIEFEGDLENLYKEYCNEAHWCIYRQTKEDFFDWAELPNEQGRRNIDNLFLDFLKKNPETISSFSRDNKIRIAINDFMSAVSEALKVGDVNEAISQGSSAISLMKKLSLDDEELKHDVLQPMFDSFLAKMASLPPIDQVKITQFVVSLNKILN